MSVLKTYPDGTTTAPSKTFRIHGGRIEGTIDGLDAVRQSIELILTTERFLWPIFSSDYGAELEELIGDPPMSRRISSGGSPTRCSRTTGSPRSKTSRWSLRVKTPTYPSRRSPPLGKPP